MIQGKFCCQAFLFSFILFCHWLKVLCFSLLPRDMEAELVCVDSYGKKAGLGVLSGGGFVFAVPLHVVREGISAGKKSKAPFVCRYVIALVGLQLSSDIALKVKFQTFRSIVHFWWFHFTS